MVQDTAAFIAQFKRLAKKPINNYRGEFVVDVKFKTGKNKMAPRMPRLAQIYFAPPTLVVQLFENNKQVFSMENHIDEFVFSEEELMLQTQDRGSRGINKFLVLHAAHADIQSNENVDTGILSAIKRLFSRGEIKDAA